MEIHSFLHLHDIPGAGGFPSDPLSVPQQHPGRIVARDTGVIAVGNNSILSYLDVIAPDNDWSEKSTEYWGRELESIVALMETIELPWLVEAGPLHVIFSAVGNIDPKSEYEVLANAALRLWDSSKDLRRH